MKGQFKLLIVLLTLLLTPIIYASNSVLEVPSAGIRLKSTPLSPDCSVGCTETIADGVSSIIIDNNKTVCLTGTLDGTVTFQGAGGTLRICGSATINAINVVAGTGSATIEVTSSGVVNLASIYFGANAFSIKNWGVINGGRYEISQPFENYGTASFTSYFTLNYGVLCANFGSIYSIREVTINGIFENNEGAVLSITNFLKVRNPSGNLYNSGTIIVDDLVYNRNKIINYATGTISVAGAYKNEDASAASIVNYGVLSSETTIYCNLGVVDNRANGVINTPEFVNNKSVVNNGTIQVSRNFTNNATLLNEGVITIDEYCFNNSPGVITNSADLNVNISLFNASDLVNNGEGTIDVAEYFVNNGGGTVTNSSFLTVAFDFLNKNSSTLRNTNSGIINAQRAFKNDSASLVDNQSMLIVTSGFDNTNLSEIINSGTLTINHTLTNTSASTVINSGDISIAKNLTNLSSVINNGSCNVVETLYNTQGTFENNDKLYVNTGITQAALFLNRGELLLEGLFSSSLSSSTLLDDGAVFNVKNLDVYGTITGENDYSSITVEGATKIYSQGIIDGAISLLDKNGIDQISGTIASSVVREAPVTNTCLLYNGSTQYLEVNNTSSLNLQTYGTVEAMVKLSSYNEYAGLVCKGSANTSVKQTSGYALQMGGVGLPASKEKVMFSIANGESNYAVVKSSSNLSLNRWYHVVVTWDLNFVYLYINGVLDDIQPLTFIASTNADNLIIGNQIPAKTIENSYFPFAGMLDNVRVWNQTFSKEDAWEYMGLSLAAQTNLVLNVSFETRAADNTYFISTSSPVLNAYVRNFSNIASTDRVKDEVLTSRIVLNKNVLYDQLTINSNTVLALRNNASCTNLIITTSGKLDVPVGTTLTVNGDMYIKSDASGCGQIFVEGDLVINGKVFLEQTFKGDGSWEFYTVPTAVSDFSIYGTEFGVDYAIYEYSQESRSQNGSTSAVWIQPESLVPGKGYIFAFNAPKSVVYDITGTTFMSSTTGEIGLHHTVSPRSVDHEGWNLIGNPFFTTINWNQVIFADENTTFYNDADAAIYIYNNAEQNYTTYVDGESVNGVFEGAFKPMEAFFVKAAATTPYVKIRRTQFPTSLVNRSIEMDPKDLLRATLRHGDSSDEAIIRFKSDATSNMDSKYDAFKLFDNDTNCHLFTKTKDNKVLSINTLSTDSKSVELDVYVQCPSVGDYVLEIATDELNESKDLYLIDKLTGNYTNLKKANQYSFIADKTGTFNRFLLVMRAMEINTSVVDGSLLTSVFSYDGVVRVVNGCDLELKVYDLSGRIIYHQFIESDNYVVNKSLTPGVYVVTVGAYTQKVVVE